MNPEEYLETIEIDLDSIFLERHKDIIFSKIKKYGHLCRNDEKKKFEHLSKQFEKTLMFLARKHEDVYNEWKSHLKHIPKKNGVINK